MKLEDFTDIRKGTESLLMVCKGENILWENPLFTQNLLIGGENPFNLGWGDRLNKNGNIVFPKGGSDYYQYLNDVRPIIPDGKYKMSVRAKGDGQSIIAFGELYFDKKVLPASEFTWYDTEINIRAGMYPLIVFTGQNINTADIEIDEITIKNNTK